jgi:hypothetical protein
MGMNNWGGVTEHMFKKPRSVFSNHKRYDIKRENPKKMDVQINEEEIFRVKSRKLIRDLLIWYVIPVVLSIPIILLILKFYNVI